MIFMKIEVVINELKLPIGVMNGHMKKAPVSTEFYMETNANSLDKIVTKAIL